MDDRRISLVEHLADLRRALLVSVGSVAAGTIIGCWLAPAIFNLLKFPAVAGKLVYFGPVDGAYILIRIAVIAGLAMASPVIIGSLAWFVGPGLTDREKSAIVVSGAIGTVLFVLGATYGLKVVMPVLLSFLLSFALPGNMEYIAADEYLSFVLAIVTNCGLAVEIPLFIFILLRLGVISPGQLAAQRTTVLFLLAGVVLFLSPGSDVLTQVLIALPVYLLFEATILIDKLLRIVCANSGGD